jgi:hypothetical protein
MHHAALLTAAAVAAAASFTVKGHDGTWKFTPDKRSDGVPCLDTEGPSGAGSWCFVAVGKWGGWALEAQPDGSEHDTIFYGTTIRAARTVKIGKVATIKTHRYSKRYGVRFFAARVPARALKVKRNRIVALDRKGRLLGRQHWDENGSYGRCDGIWDRKHCPVSR